MDINVIGSTDEGALFCHTDHPPYPGLFHSGGNWFTPNGMRVVHGPYVSGLTQTRSPMLVRLKRTRGNPAEGIYHCTVQDDTSTYQRVYVGLYSRGGGIYS